MESTVHNPHFEIPIARTNLFARVDARTLEIVGKRTVSLNQAGYPTCQFILSGGARRCVGLHQIAMFDAPEFRAPKGIEIDHIHGDLLDARPQSLRLVTRSQNARNRRPHSRSGYRGVVFCEDRSLYRAALWVNGRNIYLGFFETGEEAARAFDRGMLAHFPLEECGRLNFPTESPPNYERASPGPLFA